MPDCVAIFFSCVSTEYMGSFLSVVLAVVLICDIVTVDATAVIIKTKAIKNLFKVMTLYFKKITPRNNILGVSFIYCYLSIFTV